MTTDARALNARAIENGLRQAFKDHDAAEACAYINPASRAVLDDMMNPYRRAAEPDSPQRQIERLSFRWGVITIEDAEWVAPTWFVISTAGTLRPVPLVV